MNGEGVWQFCYFLGSAASLFPICPKSWYPTSGESGRNIDQWSKNVWNRTSNSLLFPLFLLSLGVVEEDCVETNLIREIEVSMSETEHLIHDNLDKIKEKLEEDFEALNSLQEMLHLLRRRQVRFYKLLEWNLQNF